MGKTALITGISGQDGSYLAELLLSKGYKVIGTVRSKNPKWPWGFNPEHPNLEIMQLDLNHVRDFKFPYPIDELYNLAAQSHVGYSFERPGETYRVTGVGACELMDFYFTCFPDGKFYQASSSEMFGNNIGNGFLPVSPYGIAKLMAYYNTMRQEEAGRFACTGILFNHESERRHESFVTQKICKYAVMAYKWREGYQDSKEKPQLNLGDVSTKRDWGYAPEYVKIMYEIMQLDYPYFGMVGTGKSYSVEQFLEKAFDYVGLNCWDFTTATVPSLIRPQEIDNLFAYEYNKLLDRPHTDLDGLIKIMMEHQKKVQGVEDV